MRINEARRYHTAFGIDLAVASFDVVTHFNDPITGDRNVGPTRWTSGSIDHVSVSNNEVGPH
jgi:hypothetical protein